MSQGDSRDRRAGLTTDRLTDVNGNATETFNGAPSASVPTSGIPLLKRAPPHMRRLGGALQVSSPSDNPSPCSQKLMATDLQKGAKPRPFKSLLTGGVHGLHSQSQLSASHTGDGPMMEMDHEVNLSHQKSHPNMTNDLIDGDDNGAGEGGEMPPSPTRIPGGLARSK